MAAEEEQRACSDKLKGTQFVGAALDHGREQGTAGMGALALDAFCEEGSELVGRAEDGAFVRLLARIHGEDQLGQVVGPILKLLPGVALNAEDGGDHERGDDAGKVAVEVDIPRVEVGDDRVDDVLDGRSELCNGLWRERFRNGLPQAVVHGRVAEIHPPAEDLDDLVKGRGPRRSDTLERCDLVRREAGCITEAGLDLGV